MKKQPTKKTKAQKPLKKRVAKNATKVPAKTRASGLQDAHEKVSERRYEVRELANSVTFVAISFSTDKHGGADYTFKAELSALLIDRSLGGCSLVFMKANPLTERIDIETKVVLKFANEGSHVATVRWTKSLDARLLNAGFAYGAN
jgi:hypothetical protein